MGTSEAEQLIDRFVAAWARCDVNELLDFFTDDAVWHPMPVKPAVGKDELRALISAWLQTTPRGQIRRQISDGNVVMHERTDRCTLNGRELEEPIAAVFEIDNGRISAWREYFDMSPYIAP